MSPTFEDPARVWIERSRSVRFGDVLVYRSADMIVVHRVVTLIPRLSFRTKGDGLPHVDLGRVTRDAVLGRVVEIQRGGEHYRTDGAGGRTYAAAAAFLSSIEGLAYRVAWRLDRAVGAARRNRMVFRALVSRTGRTSLGLLDRTLFRAMNARIPSPSQDATSL
jgi:hypothetical protein